MATKFERIAALATVITLCLSLMVIPAFATDGESNDTLNQQENLDSLMEAESENYNTPNERPIITLEPPKPPAENTEPPVEPTEPPVVPTEPPVDPTESPVNPDPLSDDGLIDIIDEDVPLADVPKTGDLSTLWMALSGLSAGGLLLLNRKKED